MRREEELLDRLSDELSAVSMIIQEEAATLAEYDRYLPEIIDAGSAWKMISVMEVPEGTMASAVADRPDVSFTDNGILIQGKAWRILICNPADVAEIDRRVRLRGVQERMGYILHGCGITEISLKLSIDDECCEEIAKNAIFVAE